MYPNRIGLHRLRGVDAAFDFVSQAMMFIPEWNISRPYTSLSRMSSPKPNNSNLALYVCASAFWSAFLKSLRTRTHRTLCAVLVKARTDAGLNQTELARKLKRSQSFVSKIEAGERRMDVVEFIEIARALGREPAELLSLALK